MVFTDSQQAQDAARCKAWEQFWHAYGVLLAQAQGVDVVHSYRLDEEAGMWPPQTLDVDAEERDTSPTIFCTCTEPHDPQEVGGAEFCNFCHSPISPH